MKAPVPLPTVQDCLILPPYPKEEPRPSPPPHDSAQTSISMPCPSHPAVPPRVPVDPAAALGLTLFSMTPSTRGHPRPLRRPGQRHPRTASRSTSRPLMMLCDRLHTKSTSCDIQEYHELLKEQKMMILYVFFLRAIVYVYQIQHNKWLLVMQQIPERFIHIEGYTLQQYSRDHSDY